MSRVVLVSLCRVCIILCFYLLFPCHATNVLTDIEHWRLTRTHCIGFSVGGGGRSGCAASIARSASAADGFRGHRKAH